MKIFVKSRKEMRNQWYSNKTWFEDKNKYFITIAGLSDNLDWAYPFFNSHVLKLKFDDVTEYYVEDLNLKNNVDIILFDNTIAKRIKDFVLALPTDCTLYINCAAGISRSGAVGYCINEFINRDNLNDFKFFEKMNNHIQPNPYVKRILQTEFFGETNWEEVFKNKLN